jgi:hypothetical protein
MPKLSELVERKFIESVDVADWEIDTDSGWQSVTSAHMTVPYDVWRIVTDGGELLAADTHILFDERMNEIFLKDCVPGKTTIMTRSGPQTVKLVERLDTPPEHMYDVTVDSSDHRLYTGEFLSHNSTTTCAFILWYIIFHSDKTVGLLANKGETAREIFGRIQLAYQYLPKWLQQGVVEWNKGSIELENNSRVVASATSSSAARGYTFNLIFIDEAAHIDNWEEFFTSVAPTVTSGKTTKIILVSTPNGLNSFYKTWALAKDCKNGYNPIMVRWDSVPGRDQGWREKTLADINFDLEKFAQEQECEFIGSSGTLIAGWKLRELIANAPNLRNENLMQYEQPVKDHRYVMVCDVSRGKGLDYSAFQIVDVTELPYRQVCTYRNNLITPVDFAEIAYRMAKAYCDAYVLVEVNDIGEQVSHTMHYEYGYENVLFTENAGRSGKRITSGFGGGSVDKGIRTTKVVKTVGCSLLKLLIEQNKLTVVDAATIGELNTFSRKGDRYEAEPGCHDDMVMCLVLFAWLTDQQYFKDVTDINTIMALRDKTSDEIDDELASFVFIVDGSERYVEEIADASKPSGYGWIMDESNVIIQ